MKDEILIEKLIFGGQGLGKLKNKIAMIWNALPEEIVEARIFKKRKNYLEGIAEKIITPRTDRLKPVEPHFASCGPWQILSFDEENKWKQKIAEETYSKIGDFKTDFDLEIVSDENNQYNYRNKIEYSFAKSANGKISFAFFGRGSHYLLEIDDCKLANPQINTVAHKILGWINTSSLPLESLKTLILRSNTKNEVIAALFLREELKINNSPELNNKFLGFYIYFSNPLCPASTPDKLIFGAGQDFLINEINGVKLKFGLLSFFQVNVPIFEIALREIENHIDKDSSLTDYYAGVGAISLPLFKKFKDCVLIESNDEAVKYSKENLKLNNIKNCKSKLSPAEKMIDDISSNKILILDPPRTGLHNKMVQKILDEKPFKIVYLSCNLSTQARDINLLKEAYNIKFLRLYNFFPRTPHIEGLCVLEKNS